LLHPRSFADDDQATLDAVFIPTGLQWFEFTGGSGTERLYLFASTRRLRRLEDNTESYVRVSALPRAEPIVLAELRRRVLEEARRLILEHYDLAARPKEDVVLAAGEFRGLDESFEFPAQRVSFGGFYARTIRISH
jgi:hypothetical protein